MLSVTALPSFLYCKRKLYLNSVLGLREPINVALVKGMIRHKVYEGMSKREEWIVKAINKKDFQEILSAYKKEHQTLLRNVLIKHKGFAQQLNLDLGGIFQETFPLILEETRMRATNIFNLIEKEQALGEELWLRVVPKAKSEFRIESERIGLKGVIDRLDVYEDGLIPVELKTGKAPGQGVWNGHKVQIAAYCMLLEDYFDVPIRTGTVSYLDSRQERNIVMNPFLKEEIQELTEKANMLLDSGEMPAFDKNNNKCTACGLRSVCFDEKYLKQRQKVTSAQ